MNVGRMAAGKFMLDGTMRPSDGKWADWHALWGCNGRNVAACVSGSNGSPCFWARIRNAAPVAALISLSGDDLY